MPTPVVPPVNRVAEKWARRVATATEDYAQGATAASERWQSGATAAAQVYSQAVVQAAQQGRYAKGIARVGAQRFRRGITEKGSQRYGPGAAAAQPDFAGAMAPVLEVIGRTDLPPRGPRGAEGNLQRVAAIAKALRQFAVSR
jgi:hypothetical protein